MCFLNLGEKKPALESGQPNQENIVMNDPGVFGLDS